MTSSRRSARTCATRWPPAHQGGRGRSDAAGPTTNRSSAGATSRRWSSRLDELDDEEAREIDAITERYAEVKPHTTAAAVVFALDPR